MNVAAGTSMDSLANRELVDALKACTLFSGLPDEALGLLAAVMFRRHAAGGERLIREGDPGEELFLIHKGTLEVIEETPGGAPRRIAAFGPGAVVGEISLLTGERRTASVYARGPADYFVLTREGFQHVGEHSPAAQQLIIDSLTRRAARSRMQKVVRTSGLFRELSEETLSALENELEMVLLTGGATLMRKGEPSDSLYIVIGGRLGVMGHPEGEAFAGQIMRGQTVGETGLLSGQPRSATVIATRDTLLARLSADSFYRLLDSHPGEIARHLIAPAMRRLTDARSADHTDVVSSIALVPLSPSAALTETAEKLAASLGKLGSTLHLSSREHSANLVDVDSGGSEANQAGFVLWLSEQELQHRFVLYEADPADLEWTRRCIRQADQILFLGDGREAAPDAPWSAPGEASPYVTKRLVLLHPPQTVLPSGTAAWLARYRYDTHHHVRVDRTADYDRLARLLAGQGAGLVLSGGGARGYAQIGVVHAIQQRGIPIDWICGVSAGSIIAGLYAMGLDEPAIMAKMRAVQRPIDYTLPVHALTQGKAWTDSMNELFEDAQIEDFWLPYCCVSANLTQARQQIHTTGPAALATRASGSMPGLVPPVYWAGDVLVDGGIFNNMPVDLLKTRAEVGVVIAVDVGLERGSQAPRPFQPYASGWRSFWQRFAPGSEPAPVPSIAQVLILSFGAASTGSVRSATEMADLLLRPPVSMFGLTDFGAFERVSEMGYRYAVEELGRLEADGTLAGLGLLTPPATG